MIARGSEVSYMPICSQWWEQEVKVGKSSRVVLAITCLLCSAVAGQQQQPAPPVPVASIYAWMLTSAPPLKKKDGSSPTSRFLLARPVLPSCSPGTFLQRMLLSAPE